MMSESLSKQNSFDNNMQTLNSTNEIDNNGNMDPDIVELRPVTGSQKKYPIKKLSPTSETTYRYYRNQVDMGIAGRSI
jgi:hypothetical protein